MVHYKRKPKQLFLINVELPGKRFQVKMSNWVGGLYRGMGKECPFWSKILMGENAFIPWLLKRVTGKD